MSGIAPDQGAFQGPSARLLATRLWHRLWHGGSQWSLGGACANRARPEFGSTKPPQQKTPRRGGGALLGLLQGGEICISIYVDPWEVGEHLLSRRRQSWEAIGAYVGGGLSQKVLVASPSLVSPSESLTSVRTYVRFVCEWGHINPLLGGQGKRLWHRVPRKRGSGSGLAINLADWSRVRIGSRFGGSALALRA